MTRTIGTVCIAAFLGGCAKHQETVRTPTVVRTTVVEMASGLSEVRYSGVVAPETQADLAFRVSGYVVQIGRGGDGSREIAEGDTVPAGFVLARLRPVEYEKRAAYAKAVVSDAEASLAALKAQLNEADETLAQARRDYDRAAALYAEKAMTRADYEAIETKRNSSAARRTAIAAQIASQEARWHAAEAQQADAAVNLGDTALAAPFAGIVIAKRIAVGSLASPGTPAFVLADVRTVKVSFGVPDIALRSIRLGDGLQVSAEAVPDRDFEGRVSTISPTADAASRVFPVQVRIPNADQRLKVGMVATVSIRAKGAAAAPVIPLAAVVKARTGTGTYAVYTIESRDGVDRVRQRTVTLGAVRGNSVLIPTGLSAGERVVATGGLQLADGEVVRLLPRGEAQ